MAPDRTYCVRGLRRAARRAHPRRARWAGRRRRAQDVRRHRLPRERQHGGGRAGGRDDGARRSRGQRRADRRRGGRRPDEDGCAHDEGLARRVGRGGGGGRRPEALGGPRRGVRGQPAGEVKRRWALAWLGGAVLGVANGTARQALCAPPRRAPRPPALDRHAARLAGRLHLGARAALAVAFGRRRRHRGRDVARVTIAFEFGFGRAVAQKPWEELLADYDLARGRLWLLIPAWMALGPLLVSRRAGY